MNRIKYLILAALALPACIACNGTDEDKPAPADYQEMSFTGNVAQVPGLDIKWSAGDAISIFDGKANQKFVTETDGVSVQFSGTANANSNDFRGLSLYKAKFARYSGYVTANIPSVQDAVKNGVDNKYLIQAAYTRKASSTLDFNLLSAIIKLDVDPSGYDLVSIQIATKGGEKIAGDCKVGLFETPTIESVEASSSNVSLSGADISGTYYAVVIPQLVNSGFTISFVDANDARSEVSVAGAALKAGEITDLGTFSNLEFVEAVNPNPSTIEGAVILKAGFKEGEFNLLSDPGFEMIDLGGMGARSCWKGIHTNVTLESGRTGSKSLKLVNDVPEKWNELYTQCIGFRLETDYVYHAWGKAKTPHCFNGVRLSPNGPLVERGGAVPPKSWSSYDEPSSWVEIEQDFATGGCFYGDVFLGLWGDAGAYAQFDDVRVAPKGYDKVSMDPVFAVSSGSIANATFDEISSIGRIAACTSDEGKVILALSNATISGVEYDSAVALAEKSDNGLKIVRIAKNRGKIAPIATPAEGEISIVPDALFVNNGKIYLHYFATRTEVDANIWTASRAGFLVSDDGGLTWGKAGEGIWTGDGKFAQAGFYAKDGFMYLVGTNAGRSNDYYANFFAARAADGKDFTDPAAYEYWNGKAYDSETTEANVGPEALLTVGDKSEPAVVYNPKFGRYMLIYRSNKHQGLVYRDAESPEGFWSGEKLLTRDEDTGVLSAPSVLGVDDEGNVTILATKVM